MMRYNISTISALAAVGLALAACSSTNIKGEWSCPIDQPDGCLDIPVADDMAIDDMSAASGAQDAPPRASIQVRRTPVSSSWASPDESDPATAPAPAEASGEETVEDAIKDRGAPIDLTASISGQDIDEDTQGTAEPLEAITEDASQDASQDNSEDAGGGNGPVGIPSGAVHAITSRPTMTVSDPLVGLRVPERLAEVWLGPFEDEEGNYHPATRMVIIVRPASWRLP